ncbi:MAG: DUF4058 family protein [Anaerolineae bacterium]|nr:DUF4058 family protein [Anaerolineae bacterium]
MAVRSIKNQYRGINAHLQSYLQGEGDWPNFHALYIAQLALAMRADLRPLGYIVAVEQSLQIQRFERIHRPKSDITIYDTQSDRPAAAAASRPARAGEVVLSVPVMFEISDEELKESKAIAVYEAGSDREKQKHKPVAWVELLSPSNKPGGAGDRVYQMKRKAILQSGVVFVEIDYLHESPATVGGVANYPAGEDNAHPYRLVVIDPRPAFWKGEGRIREFDVDMLIPTMTIPLSGDDSFDFDFGAPYQATFEAMFYGDDVDYRELPPDFDTYSEADQARIVRRMLAVLEAAARGEDLERGGFAVDEGPALAETLARLEALRME